MNTTCDNARRLVPSYLDGELSEEQAAPLRTHLLACPACREVAKEGKSLERWFVAGPVPAVPPGFAARVARRAFAGDPGVTVLDAEEAAAFGNAAILPFVLKLTSIAAAALFFLAVMIQVRNLPGSDSETLGADEDVWRGMYQLDQNGDRDVDPDRSVGETPETQEKQ